MKSRCCCCFVLVAQQRMLGFFIQLKQGFCVLIAWWHSGLFCTSRWAVYRKHVVFNADISPHHYKWCKRRTCQEVHNRTSVDGVMQIISSVSLLQALAFQGSVMFSVMHSPNARRFASSKVAVLFWCFWLHAVADLRFRAIESKAMLVVLWCERMTWWWQNKPIWFGCCVLCAIWPSSGWIAWAQVVDRSSCARTH